jgi:hypothetical protein
MHINNRIIQTKQKRFFPFFSFFFVNRYDIICILIAGSYKVNLVTEAIYDLITVIFPINAISRQHQAFNFLVLL